MSDSYREQCLKAKRVREGIIGQKEQPRGRRKKMDKPWSVYRLDTFFAGRLFMLRPGRDFSRFVDEFKFATEEQAIRYADKKRREFQCTDYLTHVWVANNGGPRD